MRFLIEKELPIKPKTAIQRPIKDKKSYTEKSLTEALDEVLNFQIKGDK